MVAPEGENVATEDKQQPTDQVTTSTNPTNPRILNQKTRSHLKATRANTLGVAPLIVTEELTIQRSRYLNPSAQVPSATGEPNSTHISLHQPNIITHVAIDAVTANVYCGTNAACWTPNKYLLFDPASTDINMTDIEHFCASIVHPTTGETMSRYRKLVNDEEMRKTWTIGFRKEFGNLAQVDNKTGTGTPSMDAIRWMPIRVMDLEQAKNIPMDRVVTYARVVVDFLPQQEGSNPCSYHSGGH